MPTLQRPRRSPGRNEPATKSRVNWSRLREVATSVLVAAIVAVSVLSSVPTSAIKGFVAPVLTPVVRASGLDQGWGMFAPNPPRVFAQLEVHVIMSDGKDRVWYLSEDRSMPGLYWRKIKEEVIKRKEFRAGLAYWVVRQMTGKNERPARVVMIAQIETLPLPGKGNPEKARQVIFDKRLTTAPAGAPR